MRTERALGAILRTLLVALPIIIAAGYFGTTTRTEMTVLCAMLAYTIALFILQRRGYLLLCMNGVVFGLIILGAVESATYGSVRGAATFAQVAALTCGGIFVGRNTLIAAAALSVSTIIGLVYAQNAGWLPTPNYAVTYMHAIIYSVIIVAIALMIFYSRDLLEDIVKRLAHGLEERERAEVALRRNEARMTTLFRSSPAALAIVNYRDGRFKEINDAYERMFAIQRAQVIGQTSLDLGIWVEAEDRTRLLQLIKDAGRVTDFRARLRRGNGEVFDVLISAERLQGDTEPEILSVVVDLSAEVQARAALEKSEQRFLSAFRQSPLAMTVVRLRDRRFIEVNDANAMLLGYPREELVGRDVEEVGFWADDAERLRFAAVLREHGAVRGFDARMIRRDGGAADIRVWATIIDMAGEPCVLSTLINVTDELLAQRTVRESQAKFVALFETSPEGIAVTRIDDGTVIEINDAALTQFRLTREAVIGRAVGDLGVGHDPAAREALRAKLREQGRLVNAEAKLRRSDGSYFDALLSAATITLDGQACVLATWRDIGELNRAEEEKRRALAHFAAVFTHSPDPIAISRLRDRRIIAVNDAWVAANGYSREQVVGRTSDEIGIWEQAGRESVIAELRDTGSVQSRLTTFRRGDGSERQSLISATIIEVEGEPCMISMGRDVTQQQRAEAKVRELAASLERRVAERTAELEAANQELESFSYSVSHDLRGPLRALAGFSSILLKEGGESMSADALGYAQRINAAALRMGVLIDDLLRLSRIGRTELRREPFSLSELANRVAALMAEANAGRDVQLTVTPHMQVYADASLVRQLLENLLGNAWKFTARTDAARVEVGCEQRGGETVYFIRDNGAGFDMQYADKLFQVFQRLHHVDDFEGTGIGLSIVKRVVERHGGRIWAEGAPREGATFWFTLGG